MRYIDLKYKPTDNDIVCLFRYKPAKGNPRAKAVENIALESSTGTWTDVKTGNDRSAHIRAKVFRMKGDLAWIAYPSPLFEHDNFAQIYSSIAGNILGMKVVDSIRLEDICFGKETLRANRGPKHGIGGIRKIMGIRGRPLMGTIIKPKLGLSAKEHAKAAYEAYIGGCDLVKDDENLSNQKFNRFSDRLTCTLDAADRAEKESGERKAYLPNISAETETMLERMDEVDAQGGRYAMVDIMTVGWSGLQTVRKHSRAIIHAHRAMHAAITRSPEQGISMLAIAKTARLIGVDQLHIGTAFGKLEGNKKDIIDIKDGIESRSIRAHGNVLGQEWGGIKPTIAVSSGGVYPRLVPKIMQILGKDVVIQAGGGIHGHPDGTSNGAAAMRQAISASMGGISLEKYAKTHRELDRSLKFWGKKAWD